MQNRFYVVGTPMEKLRRSLFSEMNPKDLTQEELENSFYAEPIIRLFESYDQAKEYAHGLREKSYDSQLQLPLDDRICLSARKIRPIYTIELSSEIKLNNTYTEVFKYTEYHIGDEDEKFRLMKAEKKIELNYYQVDSMLINKENILRADFFKSGKALPPVEFSHAKPRQGCVLF